MAAKPVIPRDLDVAIVGRLAEGASRAEVATWLGQRHGIACTEEHVKTALERALGGQGEGVRAATRATLAGRAEQCADILFRHVERLDKLATSIYVGALTIEPPPLEPGKKEPEGDGSPLAFDQELDRLRAKSESIKHYRDTVEGLRKASDTLFKYSGYGEGAGGGKGGLGAGKGIKDLYVELDREDEA